MNETLDSVMWRLESYGLPSIQKMKDGAWFVQVDMSVNTLGSSFKVSTDFSKEDYNQTLISAALECENRIEEALKNINEEYKFISNNN